MCGFAVPSLLGWGLPLDLAHDKDQEQDHGEKRLAQRVVALEKRLTYVSHEVTEIFITGANLPIVNGLGQTDCVPDDNLIPDCPNGLGTLIVGSHDPRVGGGGDHPHRLAQARRMACPAGRCFFVRWRNRSSWITFVLLNRTEDDRLWQVCPAMRGATAMTKTDLVTRIAKDASLTKGQAEKALQAMLASVEEALRQGERVTLVGFGTFAVRARAARSGRNPRTGQPLVVPARKTPTFSVGKRLRQVVN